MLNGKRLEVVASLPNAHVHAASSAGLVFSRLHELYVIKDLANPEPEVIGRIPWGLRSWPSRIRLFERARRNGIQIALEMSGRGWLVQNRRGWWVIEPDGGCRPGPAFPAGRPLARGMCWHGESVFVGDYHGNPRRDPVRIYRSSDLCNVEVAWEFPASSVRHVHALVVDRHRPNRIWVLTGDFDHESNLYATDDSFRSVRKVLGLGQFTRATDLSCQTDSLLWGMDSPLESSHILRLGRRAALPCIEARLSGPAYYLSGNVAGACYVGTTVEPGPAVADRRARIYGTRPDGVWEEIVSLAADRFPQYGIIYLPRGILPGNHVAFSTRALVPGEGRLTIVRDLAWA